MTNMAIQHNDSEHDLEDRSSPDPHVDIGRVRALAHLLDNAFVIPGTKWRVGVDALIGLIPGVGDVLGALISSYFLFVALRLQLPMSTVYRMCANILVELAVGGIPILGDIFDAGFKSNARNAALIERHFAMPQRARTADRIFAITTVALFAALVIGIITLGLLAISLVIRWISHQV